MAEVLADALDRAADLRDAAAEAAARELDESRARAHELVSAAHAEAVAVTARASTAAERTQDQARRTAQAMVASASADAEQVLADAERTAAATRTGAARDAERTLEQARAEAAGVREAADTHARQVRTAAQEAAADARQDADRVLAEARVRTAELQAAAEEIAAQREQAAANLTQTQRALREAREHQDAAARAREEGERILDNSTRRSARRAKRREIRAASRAACRAARQTAVGTTGIPDLSRPELAGVLAVIVAAATVSTLGLLSSYTALETAAEGWGWSWPWLLPVGIDVSVPAFTGAHLVLIRLDMELRWIRWVPRTLTAVSVYLNWSASHSVTGRLGHAALTLLWVVFSEIAAHVYATKIGAVTGKQRMETVRRSRWLLAPLSTARLRRRMILWEVTSYQAALTRLQEQTWRRARLREQYGRRWRRTAPLAERMALKLDTVPTALADTLTSGGAHGAEREEDERAHPDVSARADGDVHREHERAALTTGAHDSERAPDDENAQRAGGGLTRGESDALTKRRLECIRRLYTELGFRPEWKEIRTALTDAGLSDRPVSRPTAQRLRTQAERAWPALCSTPRRARR
ncbi:DUF2637 domain-containing protein [Streptomyces sp. NPDC053474]|uniref:DUF2637 domain-containing protein n=1 Tax=Streptomyces sp. NPDC053474 TaxID=3365704 RepID=UPI0037D7B4C2